MTKMFLLALMICTSLPVLAIRIEYGRDIIISHPVYEDLYIAGGNITLNAPVYGDLIIAGGTILINDSVMSDILVAGGTVTLNGFVGDDVRCAGGKIFISQNVTGDVVMTGGSLTIANTVTIGGLLASGGNITIHGNVNGELRGVFGDLNLNGKISGNVDCRAGTITVNGSIEGKTVMSARYILIGSNGTFKNDVRYWSEQNAIDFKQKITSGTAVYDPSLRIRNDQWYYLGAASLVVLLWYLSMALLMILIVQYLFSPTLRKAADTVYNNAIRSLWWGFLFLIAVPIAAVIALVTIVGVPLGLFLLFSFIGLLLLATVITSAVTAHWVNNRFNKKWNYWQLSFAGFGIFVLLKLVFLIPIVGGLSLGLLVCMAFGGILQNVQLKRKELPDTINI